MGGSNSKSKTNQTYNSTYVNKNDVDILNSSVNENITNIVSKQAKSCSSSVLQNQTVNISNITVRGPGSTYTGDIDQDQNANVTFECVQISDIKNDIGNDTVTKYMDALKNNFTTDALANLNSTAGANAQNSIGGIGYSQSNSKSNSQFDFKSNNTSNTNIRNIVQNAVQNNLNMENVKTCISNVISNQNVNETGINVLEGATYNRGISQKQSAVLFTSCMQKSGDANNISSAIASNLGITIDNDNKQTNKTTMETEAIATAQNKGYADVIGSLGTAVGNITNSPGCILYCIIIYIVLTIISAILTYIYMTNQNGGDSMLGGFNNNSTPVLKNITKALVQINKSKL